jgi:4-nitrophenyl phosphatase
VIFIEEALSYFQLAKEEVVLVGDNLETDILCGINGGIQTIFVLGGVHGVSDIERLKFIPDRTISSLLELIQSHKIPRY